MILYLRAFILRIQNIRCDFQITCQKCNQNNSMENELSRFQKINVYLGTLFVVGGYMCILGIASRVKKPIADELGLPQSFLGLLDGLVFLSGTLATIYLYLFPFKKPVKASVILSIVSLVATQIQILPIITPGLVKPIFIVSKLVLGFCIISLVVNMAILTHYFQSESDQPLLQIWYGLSSLGDPFGILSCEYFLSIQNMSWELAMTFSLVFYAISIVYFYFGVKEIPVQQTGSQGLKKLKEALVETKRYYENKVNIIQSLSYALLNSTYFLLLLWLPYFFLNMGYKKQASLVAVTFPIVYIFGISAFQLIRKIVPLSIGCLFCIMMCLDVIVAFLLSFINDDRQNVLIFFILIFFASMLLSGYVSFVLTTDIKIRTTGNRQFMMVSSLNRTFWNFFLIFLMVMAGIWMQHDSQGFFKLNLIVISICALLVITRYTLYPKSFDYENKNSLLELAEEEIL